MNIFVINPDKISENAKMLDDKRLVKMVLETAQLLATAVNMNGGKCVYKVTHKNHPCSIWTRQSRENFYWLFQLFDYLNDEYTNRFGKIHKCYQYRNEFIDQAFVIPEGGLTSHPNCTKFKDEPNVYKAYKLCMLDKWTNDKRLPKWTNTEPPKFYTLNE